MSADPVHRRLAAIVAADVAGYSRLMGEDEEATLAALIAHRTELIEPCIAEHRGRVVKTTGDGVLVEFASVVDAVRCAVAFQDGMRRRNGDTPAERRIEFRVGVNLGDVIVRDDDVFGDGVNIAARLEGLAEPGGVVVSGKVRDEVRGKLEIGFDDLGPQRVKNIAEPVHACRVRDVTADDTTAAEVEAPPALPDKPSIAVLPFQNMSGDAEQEFLADGIAEDIITALSRLRWLFVIARNSTFAYKGASPDVRRVARDLGVRYVLEGSMRRAGNRVRVTGQLIDAATGNHIWAERYDRDVEDIFALQDEITTAIVRAVDPEIQGAERERALRKHPENLTAWDHYQRGLWHHHRVTRENLDRASEHLSAAIEADPGFAPARAVKSFNAYLYVNYGWTESLDDTLAEARRLAEEAIALDDKEPIAHFALGRVFTVRGEFSMAVSQLEQALELNPNFALASFGLAFAHLVSGRVADSLPCFDEAIRQSPRDPWLYVYQAAKAIALAHLDRYDEALEFCAKSMRHQSASYNPQVVHASVLGQMGRIEEARQQLAAVMAREPGLTVSRIMPAPFRVMFTEGREKFLDGLRKAGLPE